MSIADFVAFVSEFITTPRTMGAVAPSSPSLAHKMVEWIEWSKARAVIEYGPGTGAFTGAIGGRLHPQARFFAIEINPHLVRRLRRSFPSVRVHEDSVRNVRRLCDEEGLSNVDAILCGLPWASFSPQDQTESLEAMMDVLRPGGQFVTFAYLQGLLLPAGRRFRCMLREYFSHIEISRTAWLNLPPAFVYRCRR